MKAKLFFILLILIFVIVCNGIAQDFRYRRDIPPTQEQIEFNLSLKDSVSIAVVDHMNEYRLKIEVANSFEEVKRRFNDRITFEMHTGGGFFYNTKNVFNVHQ